MATIRMDFVFFADFWAPAEGKDGPIAEYVGTLNTEAKTKLRNMVELAYRDGETDGARSCAPRRYGVGRERHGGARNLTQVDEVEHDRFCEGFRMPAATSVRHTPAAGVRKPPREETALGDVRRCRGHYGDLGAAVALCELRAVGRAH
jgi:hypothetical protein